MLKLQSKLDLLYEDFFEKLNIDSVTGIVNKSSRRFATKACIGQNYPNAKRKILFISLDMGKDEKFQENTFQDYIERRNAVCTNILTDKNPHMAGVYGTALYLLQNEYNWKESWSLLENQTSFFKEAIILNHNTLPKDVLNYISLINFYNFVTIDRKDRTGSSDRIQINHQFENRLLIDSINILMPDVIIVQSQTLKNYFKTHIKSKINPKTEIYIGYHPSVFGRGIKYRMPKKYIENLIESGKL